MVLASIVKISPGSSVELGIRTSWTSMPTGVAKARTAPDLQWGLIACGLYRDKALGRSGRNRGIQTADSETGADKIRVRTALQHSVDRAMRQSLCHAVGDKLIAVVSGYSFAGAEPKESLRIGDNARDGIARQAVHSRVDSHRQAFSRQEVRDLRLLSVNTIERS